VGKRRDRVYVHKLNRVISEERWREMSGAWTSQADHIAKTITELEAALLTSGADDAREAFELLEQASELYVCHPFKEQARGPHPSASPVREALPHGDVEGALSPT